MILSKPQRVVPRSKAFITILSLHFARSNDKNIKLSGWEARICIGSWTLFFVYIVYYVNVNSRVAVADVELPKRC